MLLNGNTGAQQNGCTHTCKYLYSIEKVNDWANFYLYQAIGDQDGLDDSRVSNWLNIIIQYMTF